MALGALAPAHLGAADCSQLRVLHEQADAVAPGSGVLAQGTAPPQEPDVRDSEAADDFAVPAGEVWSVDTVRVELFATPPPAEPPGAVKVAFHRDDGGKPGQIVCAYPSVVPETVEALGQTVEAVDPEGVQRLTLALPAACTLCAGTRYWLSVQPLGSPAGVFHWRQRTAGNLAPEVWRNPQDGLGTGCTDWSAPAACGQGDGVSPDLVFSLQGRSQTPGAVNGDFNGDLCADLVFQSQTTGEVVVWYMNGTVRIGEAVPLAPQPPAGWHVVGTRDFTRDGASDLVLQDAGENVWLWIMDGVQRTGVAPGVLDLAPDEEPLHRLLGTADASFGGDPDLVCHGTKGSVTIWDMIWSPDEGGWLRRGTLTLEPAPEVSSWQVKAAADFDGDGNLDVLFNDAVSSAVDLWRFDEHLSFLDSRPTTPSAPAAAGWQVVAAADFGAGPDGPEAPAPECGALDLVWQNAASFKTVVWHLNRSQERTGGLFTTPDGPGPDWIVVGPR